MTIGRGRISKGRRTWQVLKLTVESLDGTGAQFLPFSNGQDVDDCFGSECCMSRWAWLPLVSACRFPRERLKWPLDLILELVLASPGLSLCTSLMRHRRGTAVGTHPCDWGKSTKDVRNTNGPKKQHHGRR